MKKIAFILIGLYTLATTSCKSGSNNNNSLTINLEPKSNSTVQGTATFVEKNGKILMTAKLTGLKPGVHAIHLHEKADCSSADATSSGGHWNPTFKKHGKWGDAEHHKGDIGNFTADSNGKATLTFETDEWCLGCNDATKNIIEKAVIVHDKADDFTTQPTGNAGARVACSAIIR